MATTCIINCLVCVYLQYLKQLDQENKEVPQRKTQYNKNKKKQYQDLEQQLKESGEAQTSTTDTDSRAVVFQRNSVKIGYNIQAASDSDYKLLIAADTGDVNDTKALAVMVKKAQENIGQVENVLADKGYNSGRELKACEELGVTSYLSPKEHSSSNKNGYAMKDFKYNQKKDNLRVNANPNYYRQRQQIIEHQFGTLKRHRHFDYLVTRGKEKVLGEVYLSFTMYNLRRTVSIFGVSEILRRLKACLLAFSTLFKLMFAIHAITVKKNIKSSMIHRQSCN